MQPEIDATLAHLRALMRRGREIHEALTIDPAASTSLAAARVWQHDCAAAVSQLSGGSKAHWLSRAYSAALLVRRGDGAAQAEADVAEIVARVVEVLERGAASLTQPDVAVTASASGAQPAPRRFDFVRHEALRPMLERAYADSGRALEEGDYTESLMTSCSVLEAILTDALEGRGARVEEMSFTDRIAEAEGRGLIRGGCARLPDVARAYRIDGESAIVTQRDARVARQVLHVVMRDLDPGR